MAASQILKNTNATLEVTFSVGNADATVAVTVVGADGVTVASGNATQTAPTGHYQFVLAPQAELNALTINWTGTFGGVVQTVQTFAEIVGGYLFPIADARTFGDQTLTDTVKYPDAAIRGARERISGLFEQVCGYPFIPRFARDTLDGNGGWDIEVYNTHVNRVIAVTMDSVALTSPQLADIAVRPSGIMIRRTAIWNWAFGGRNIQVSYEYGLPTAPPDIVRAALILARYELVSNDISDRMISFQNDLGSVRLSIPSMNNPTGVPVVDSTLARYTDLGVMVP